MGDSLTYRQEVVMSGRLTGKEITTVFERDGNKLKVKLSYTNGRRANRIYERYDAPAQEL
jgi:hypothetical protein